MTVELGQVYRNNHEISIGRRFLEFFSVVFLSVASTYAELMFRIHKVCHVFMQSWFSLFLKFMTYFRSLLDCYVEIMSEGT